MGLSLPHVLLLAVVAILLLGGGRFSALMGDVAKGMKQFKNGLANDGVATAGLPGPTSALGQIPLRPAEPNADRHAQPGRGAPPHA